MGRQAKSVGFSVSPDDLDRLDRLALRFGNGSRSAFLRAALDLLEVRARVDDLHAFQFEEKLAGRLVVPRAPGEETAERARRKFTAAEYDMMVECGIIGESEKVELLEGEIYVMPPQSRPHVYSVHKAQKRLEAFFTEGYIVFNQSTMPAGTWSKAEPDVAVAAGDWETYLESGGEPPLLVVEVALTTLATDERTKDRVYAREGIPEYWIVNLVDQLLEVHRAPEGQGDSARYARVALLGLQEDVTPLTHPNRSIPVGDFFPRH